MRRPVLTAALLLALPAAVLAYVRTTTAGRPDQGLCLWWGTRSISYQVNASAVTGAGCSPAAASSLVQASLSTWSAARRAGAGSPCTDLAFAFGGDSTATAVGYDPALPTPLNLVVARAGSCNDTVRVPGTDSCHATPGACAARYNCWEHGDAQLAITTTTYSRVTGEILDSDIEIHGWDGNLADPQGGVAGYYLTCGVAADPTCSAPPYGQASCNWVDLGEVVTHEAGHFIGLDHVCVASYPAPFNACPSPPSVMQPTAPLGETSKRILAPDDVEAVCSIYPAGAATVTCIPPPAPPRSGGGGGCAGGAAGGPALALLASLLLRRRR